jgi:IclR family pca regulon transcriptional regulator
LSGNHPLIGRHGEAVAAINISVPTTRWTPEDAEARLAAHVQVAASSISQSKFAGYSTL